MHLNDMQYMIYTTLIVFLLSSSDFFLRLCLYMFLSRVVLCDQDDYRYIPLYDGKTLRVGETRRVMLPDWVQYSARHAAKNCKTVIGVQSKFNPIKKKREEWYFNRYFIKKRKAVIDDNDMSVLKYQFIASVKPIIKGKNPGDVNDPLGLDEDTLSIPERPNEFQGQIASIFCERSIATGLRNLIPYAEDCGIQEFLVQLCFEDEDVNVRETGFTLYDHIGYIDLNRAFMHDCTLPDCKEKRERVMSHVDKCVSLVGVRMPTKGNPGPGLPGERIRKLVTKYLRGATEAGFKAVFIQIDICGTKSWEYMENGTAERQRKEIAERFSGKTQELAYFCKPKWE